MIAGPAAWLSYRGWTALGQAGTMVGFVLARTVGIFGFHLTFSSGLAWTVLMVEAAGLVMLLLTAALLWQRRQPSRLAGG